MNIFPLSRLQYRLFLCLAGAALMVAAVILSALFVLPIPHVDPTIDLPGLSDLPEKLP